MAPQIRKLIEQILCPNPPPGAIHKAVTYIHHIALSYLRHKTSAGNLAANHLGLCVEDLAFDCIGSLFARDSQSKFYLLDRYFSSLRWQMLSEEELLGATRRLVCSRVNQELCRIYRDSDPNLHRIIRNIKDIVRVTPGFQIIERRGITWIGFVAESDLLEFPSPSPEYIGPYVMMLVAQGLDTKQLLLELSALLRDQRCYAPAIALTELALLIRSSHTSLAAKGQETEVETPPAEGDIRLEDLDHILIETVNAVALRMRPAYVGRQKTTAELYQVYIDTTMDILRAEYLSEPEQSESYFQQLRLHLPMISEEAYRTQHRSILEYLVKLVRAEYLKTVKQET